MGQKKKSLSSMSIDSFRYVEAKHETVDIRCRILIVCEGEKTEPNYFKSFSRIEHGGVVYDIKCDGGKINTLQVVNKAISLRDSQAKTESPYDSVWAVFDKDDFPAKDFNAAIEKAHNNGINCAWSNEAFELWYVYHFINPTTPMYRADYQKHLNLHIGKHIKGYKYNKNDKNMRGLLLEYGNEKGAIMQAEKQSISFSDTAYATHNPSTTVFKLVRLLRGEDEEFNRQLMNDMNGVE